MAGDVSAGVWLELRGRTARNPQAGELSGRDLRLSRASTEQAGFQRNLAAIMRSNNPFAARVAVLTSRLAVNKGL